MGKRQCRFLPFACKTTLRLSCLSSSDSLTRMSFVSSSSTIRINQDFRIRFQFFLLQFAPVIVPSLEPSFSGLVGHPLAWAILYYFWQAQLTIGVGLEPEGTGTTPVDQNWLYLRCPVAVTSQFTTVENDGFFPEFSSIL